MREIIQGFLAIIMVGVLWACAGGVLARVSALKDKAVPFYAVGCWLTAVMAWLVLPDWELLRYRIPPRAGELAFWMACAAGCTVGGQLSLVRAMGMGHKGISVAVVQSAMMVPFVLSIVIWNESATPAGMAGMAMLLSAIALLALGNKIPGRKGAVSLRWALVVLRALVLIGLTQTCQSVPSHWAEWSDAARLRVPLYFTVAAVFFTLFMLARRQWPNPVVVRHAGLWSVVTLAASLLLFRGLDVLAAHGISRYAFPLAQSVCMLSFALYSALVLGESFAARSRWGLACATVGIALLSV